MSSDYRESAEYKEAVQALEEARKGANASGPDELRRDRDMIAAAIMSLEKLWANDDRLAAPLEHLVAGLEALNGLISERQPQ